MNLTTKGKWYRNIPMRKRNERKLAFDKNIREARDLLVYFFYNNAMEFLFQKRIIFASKKVPAVSISRTLTNFDTLVKT